MGWYKQHSSFSDPLNKPVVDRCINCGDQAEVKAQITMELERAIIIRVLSVEIVIQLIVGQEYCSYRQELKFTKHEPGINCSPNSAV